MKILTGACLAIGLISGHFAMEWSKSHASTKGLYDKTAQELSATKQSVQELEAVLKADKRSMTLETALSAVMLELYNTRTKHGITLSNATPAKQGGNTTLQLESLSDAVPNTSTVKSIKILLSGNYKEYPALVEYLSSMHELPVAVVSLKVQERSFEAAVRVYGRLESK